MFPISFDATKVEPIGELTDEKLEWMAEFNRQNPTVEEAAAAEHAAKVEAAASVGHNWRRGTSTS